jgi:hypothetical protein
MITSVNLNRFPDFLLLLVGLIKSLTYINYYYKTSYVIMQVIATGNGPQSKGVL